MYALRKSMILLKSSEYGTLLPVSLHFARAAGGLKRSIIDGMFGPEPIDFQGRQYWVEGAHFQHGSVQKPRPPILVAGAGEQVTLRQVARYADACNFGAGSNVGKVTENDGVRAKLAVMRKHCEEIGRPSRLYARADGGDGLIDAVEVGGSALVVARGEFRL